jgi:hypothetical protein
MTILNWGSSVGNRTIDANGFFLIPETEAQRFARTGIALPDNLVGKNDYGLGFLFTIDPTSGDGTFLLDANGLKRSSGTALYAPPGTGIDILQAVGYPPGVLESGVYINGLDLTTLRMGDGDDFFSVIGQGITQAIRAEVNIDASQGYIFQSNIFAGGGDDYVGALMPWQSVFKGGDNTVYYDAIYGSDPGGGTAVTLGDDLTLEEVPYGDLIVLKGSRFDWDIEFKDGDGDGSVSLESILDERDYVAVSNNNKIYGFERILFGDIFFDLILARQQDSSAVFGQPDYYLNGAENLAPELNSNIIQNSGLWEAFRFNRTKLQGITGTATQSIEVHTGDAADTPFLVGALQFASLFTEAGNDIAEIASADQAVVDLGGGFDQLKVNGSFSRSGAFAGDGDDNIILDTVSNSTIAVGSGRDVVEVRTSARETEFDGGESDADTLLLPGNFAAYNLFSSNTREGVTFTDGFGNRFTGFETFKFSDITLDALQTLSLTPPSSIVSEGDAADYTIALSGSGLASGESVAFSIQLANGTAQISSDLAQLVQAALQSSPGIVLRNVSVDGATGLIQAVASASRLFNPDAPIATLRLPILADLQAEPDEVFTVTLADFVQSRSVITTIRNVPPVTIRLNGPASVLEGEIATYAVVLDGVALAVGRSVTFSLDSASGTAAEGADFEPLLVANLLKADGVQLSTISTATDGTVTVTATNVSDAPLAPGAALVTAQLPVITDSEVEGNESFAVTLASSTAVVSGGLVTTTISDLVSTPTIALIGEPSIAEGQTAAYAVSLVGSSLPVSQSLTLTLDSASGTATEGIDFSALTAADLTPAAGVAFSAIATDPLSKSITLTATNSSGTPLAAGSQLVTFAISSQNDVFVEANETFNVSLGSANASVAKGSQQTTIVDGNIAAVRLDGPSSVAEGATTNPYRVALSGVGLGAGETVEFSLDVRSGSASKDGDFRGLTAAALNAAPGVRLTTSAAGANGVITIQAKNKSGLDLPSDAQLLRFSVASIQDQIAEKDETFHVQLAGKTAVLSAASVETTIQDDDPLLIDIQGPQSLVEGRAGEPYILSLGPGGLGPGQSIQLRLALASGSATSGVDFKALAFADLSLAKGVALEDKKTLADGTLSLGLVNSGTSILPPRSQLLSFGVAPVLDGIVEGAEDFQVQASLLGDSSLTRQIRVGIADLDRASLALSGPSSVKEGSATTPYRIRLRGADLGQGHEIQLAIRLAGKAGASLRSDYSPLSAENLLLASGLSVVQSVQQADGGLSLRLLNTRSRPIAAGSGLLEFSLETLADEIVESGEVVEVSLRSASADVDPAQGLISTGLVDTTKPPEPIPPDGGGDPVTPPAPKVINGTPNPDVLTGSALDNTIYGGKGADLMTGGGGSNVFRFRLRDGLNQGDVITDFRPRSDTIRLEDVPRDSLAATAFGGSSRLSASQIKSAFKVVDSLEGADRLGAVFLYSRLTGDLAYDANGSASGFGRGGGVITALPVLLDFDARDIQLVYGS